MLQVDIERGEDLPDHGAQFEKHDQEMKFLISQLSAIFAPKELKLVNPQRLRRSRRRALARVCSPGVQQILFSFQLLRNENHMLFFRF